MRALELLNQIGATTIPDSVLEHQTSRDSDWKPVQYSPVTRFLSSFGALSLPIALRSEDDQQNTVTAALYLTGGIAVCGFVLGPRAMVKPLRLITVFSTLAFALGSGGAFASMRERRSKNKLLAATMMLGMVLTTGLTAYLDIKYTRSVLATEQDIVQVLLEKQKQLTSEEVAANLPARDIVIVQQALAAAVERGVLASKEVEIRTDDGSLRRIREYYVIRQ